MGDLPQARPVRGLLILGASTLTLFSALLWGLSPRDGRPEEISPLASVEQEEAPPSVDLEGVRAAERAPIEGLALLTGDTALESDPELGGYSVSGQFILTDCLGREHAHLDGAFKLVYRRNGERHESAVPVKGGAFSFTVPNPSSFFVHDMELNDREVSLELRRELTGPRDAQHLLLTARDQCEVRLEVLDAETRRHLSDIEVWSAWDLDTTPQDVPRSGDLELALRDASSPLSLPEVDLDWGSQRTYWVRSEGYAWAKASVDHSRYSDQVVYLERGGALNVRVEGLETVTVGELRSELQLERIGGGSLSREELDPSLRHRWESVPPGLYRVSVVLGKSWETPLVLDTAEVSVEASKEAALVLAAEAPQAPEGPVRVNGTLRVPQHWRDRGFSLAFYGRGETERWEGKPPRIRRGQMAADPTESDLFRWSTEVPCEGDWEVAVPGLSVHATFTASLAFTPVVELIIPAPALVSMQIRDTESRASLPDAQLYWKTAGSESREVHVWATLEYRPGSGTHHIAIPAGETTFNVMCDGYVGLLENVELVPGPQELSFELEPTGRVDVQFTDRGAAIPVSLLDLEFEVSPLAGDGELYQVWHGSLIFDAPGSYEVKVTGITGYLDAATTITAPKSGFVEHTVELVRE